MAEKRLELVLQGINRVRPATEAAAADLRDLASVQAASSGRMMERFRALDASAGKALRFGGDGRGGLNGTAALVASRRELARIEDTMLGRRAAGGGGSAAVAARLREETAAVRRYRAERLQLTRVVANQNATEAERARAARLRTALDAEHGVVMDRLAVKYRRLGAEAAKTAASERLRAESAHRSAVSGVMQARLGRASSLGGLGGGACGDSSRAGADGGSVPGGAVEAGGGDSGGGCVGVGEECGAS